MFIHAESTRVNLQTQQNNYVAASRAKVEAKVYTDSKEKLIRQLDRNTGQKETAIDRPSRDDPPPPGNNREAEKDRKIKEGEIIRKEIRGGKSIPEAIAIAQKETGGEREAVKAKAREAEKDKPKAKEQGKDKDKDKDAPMIRQSSTQQVSVERDGQQQQSHQPQPQREMQRERQQPAPPPPSPSRDRGMER